MKEQILFYLHSLPFLVTVNNKTDFNWTRIIEALIIAGLTAYITVAKMEVKINYIENSLQKNDLRIEKLNDKIEKITRDFLVNKK